MVGIRALSFGSATSAAAPAGTARIRQDLALLDAMLSFRRNARVHPVIVAGAGLYHMSLSGSGAAPFIGRSDTAWSAAAAAGVGLSVDLSARAAIGVESQALWVWPEARVQIDTADVGRAGRPSLSHMLGLRLWL
jgi:opacity protein-like surface antigen